MGQGPRKRRLLFPTRSAKLDPMGIRALSGALIVLFLFAPLSSALCGSCTPDGCPLGMTAAVPDEAAETVDPHAAHHQPATAPATSHCQPADAAKEAAPPEAAPSEAAPCDGTLAMAVDLDCCALAATPAPDVEAVAAAAISFGFTLASSSTLDVPIVPARRGAEERRTPLQPPRSLYMLNSAFLI